MAVLGKLIGAMKTGASGAISVSSGMANIVGKIASTAGKIGNFITGGPREQSYGYTSQYFPMRDKKSKLSKTRRVTQIRPSVTPLPGAGSMGMGYNSGDEKLSQMFEFMKRTHDQNMTKIEIQNSFAKERANEDANRHRELLGAIRKFTDIKTTTATPVIEKKESVGLLDIFKKMLESAVSGVMSVVNGLIDGVQKSLEWLSELKPLLKYAGTILKFITSPLLRGVLLNPYVLGFATALALAKYLAAQMPDYSKITPEEAKNALENGSPDDIKALGGREKLIGIINESNEGRTDGEPPLTFIPQTETQRRNITPRPDTTGGKNKARAMSWDRKFGETHNDDGTPKVKTTAKPLVSGVEESTAEAGRGTAALDDYRARMLEQETGGKAAFGVTPKGIKTTTVPPTPTPPSPLPPAPSSLPDIIDENINLENNKSVSPDIKPIVSVTGSSQTTKAPPISSSATWRDDEPMIDRVLQRTRAYV